MNETAGPAMNAKFSEGTIPKTRPKIRKENGGRGNRAMALEHTDLPKNKSTDRARYTDSETNEESPDPATPSGTAEASASWLRKKPIHSNSDPTTRKHSRRAYRSK